MIQDPSQLDDLDKRREHDVYRIKVDILGLRRRWHEWRTKLKERPKYGWVYECGCKAPWGGGSLPYCNKHGMRLMRYKKK